MSDTQNFDNGAPPRSPHRDEPDDDIGNRVASSDADHPEDDIGNRLPDGTEAPHVDDDIGNRHGASPERPGPAASNVRRRRRRRRRGEGRSEAGPADRGPADRTAGDRSQADRGSPERSAAPRRHGERRSEFDDDDGPTTQYVLKSDPELKRARAEEVCAAIVQQCQREATVKAELVDENGQPKVVVLVTEAGNDSPLFTRNSAALSALNFLTNKVVNRFPDDRIRLVVHVQHAGGPAAATGPGRAPAMPGPEEEALRTMALGLATHAVRANRVLSLAPMRPDVRRVVHVTLESHPEVVTMSEGEGNARKLLVVPRGKLPETPPPPPPPATEPQETP